MADKLFYHFLPVSISMMPNAFFVAAIRKSLVSAWRYKHSIQRDAYTLSQWLRHVFAVSTWKHKHNNHGIDNESLNGETTEGAVIAAADISIISK